MKPSPELCNQLDMLGHVYVPDVYDPDLGLSLGAELDLLFRTVKPRQIMAGEQLRNTERLLSNPDQHPNLTSALQAIGDFAATVLSKSEFDRRLWPSALGRHALIQAIDMNPVTIRQLNKTSSTNIPSANRVYGAWHTDRPDIVDLVAITTYEGESKLEIKDTDTYTLCPGGVVFFDNRRRPQLWHRGYADQPRRALGLASIRNKIL